MSISHIVILGLIILIAVPPEKLPEILRNIGRIVGELKRQTSGLFDNKFQIKDLNLNNEIKKDYDANTVLTPEDLKKKLDDQSKQS